MVMAIQKMINIQASLPGKSGRTSALGTKPTTLGTNMPLLRYLDGKKGEGSSNVADPEGLLDRMKLSRSWAAWPTAFKEEVVKAILDETRDPMVKKLSREQWVAALCQYDHLPFNRNCKECQIGAGRTRAHKRVPSPDTFALSVDVCGPFADGIDQSNEKGKYFLVGVFTIPITKGEGVECSRSRAG